ncbi:N-6 DNA methylase [Burkholderia glumae]|uniref:SAM-dependent methyltransferase n=1 Tax=Burkholderia glumae TaxID=337 RepID=A0ABY5BHT3_BURGL|nr:N-6 DNA methylase [Burkholderia glumae]MCM2481829.1 SAM-dependent methyltransferase [Burkholderia glumae]MCM2491568.1 SAM-dependent methyltransferase [Burkholderia glumae]MCM2508030.1 SAM-dependent methyltransferase [Burkholderia glumae]MCM2536577.1 SAM-dependent methyltransferase [Burkholderia glumae]NVE23145.1 N-6 DNA methylase [Burkholderia glumae]
MATRHREETINTQLAVLISKMGVNADAETILAKGQHRPDVLFVLRGLRVAIEGKFSDLSGAEDVVLNDARHRVSNGIAHIAAAAVYPKALRTVATSALEAALGAATLRFKIVSEFGETEDWFEGDPAALMDALRRAQESLAQDNIVEQTAKALSERLEGVAQLWSGQVGPCDRLGNLLGMVAPKGETPDKASERRETTAKVAALVLANALIFQEQLSNADGRIRTLRKLEKDKDAVAAAKSHWNWIWTNINYVPIFQLGEHVLEELPISKNTTAAFRALLTEAMAICSNQAALRHDLMGRIYHWLLHHAKFLGTYYTSVSAATLLLKLAISRKWQLDFGDPSELAEFKVADLACGTGTLLMATAEAVSDAYIGSRASTGRSLNPTDLQTLHRALMENVLHGYDVLPSAIHLTASTLALLAPEVSFVRMNLYVMPMGMDGNAPRLGSLDFISSQRLPTQIAIDHSQAEVVKTGAGTSHIANAVVPKLDLCVMNPPFVRSVGGNLLFGSLPDERGRLQTELKAMIKDAAKRGYPSSATAGLGSVFLALADMQLKVGGRVAFVLPAAVVSGEAWGESRKLIAEKYELEIVVASHDAERPNFSENTDLSEVLFIAKKRAPKEPAGPTLYVNLWRNPRTIHEALDLAARIEHNKPTSIQGDGFSSIRGVASKLGEAVELPPATGGSVWVGALFAQTSLLRAYWHLEQGLLHVPGSAPIGVKLARLTTFGKLGYDRRDIHDAFTVSKDDWSQYASFWDHKADKVTSLKQVPNSHLIARDTPAPGRPLKDAKQVWAGAGRILLVERVRTNTHRVLAVGFEKEVLGNTWWAMKSTLTVPQEKALLLWLNSSLTLLMVFGRRVVTEGAWMQMKKPAWESMPVLDVCALTTEQTERLAQAFDLISVKQLDALSKLASDSVRAEIDDALSVTLGLPDLSNLRALLAREPGLTAKPIAPKQLQGDMLSEEQNSQDQQHTLF